jgi:hypothetical protein
LEACAWCNLCAGAVDGLKRKVAGSGIEESGYEEWLPECQQSCNAIDGGLDGVFQLSVNLKKLLQFRREVYSM